MRFATLACLCALAGCGRWTFAPTGRAGGKIIDIEERVVQEGRFVDGDVLQGSNYAWSIADDGAAMLARFDEKPSATDVRFGDVDPRTRRAALLVFVALTFGSAWGPGERHRTATESIALPALTT